MSEDYRCYLSCDDVITMNPDVLYGYAKGFSEALKPVENLLGLSTGVPCQDMVNLIIGLMHVQKQKARQLQRQAEEVEDEVFFIDSDDICQASLEECLECESEDCLDETLIETVEKLIKAHGFSLY